MCVKNVFQPHLFLLQPHLTSQSTAFGNKYSRSSKRTQVLNTQWHGNHKIILFCLRHTDRLAPGQSALWNNSSDYSDVVPSYENWVKSKSQFLPFVVHRHQNQIIIAWCRLSGFFYSAFSEEVFFTKSRMCAYIVYTVYTLHNKFALKIFRISCHIFGSCGV